MKKIFRDLGILVLAASMTAGCGRFDEEDILKYQAAEKAANKEKVEQMIAYKTEKMAMRNAERAARYERRKARRMERNLPDEVVVTGQIVETKTGEYSTMSRHFEILHWKLITNHGPKLVEIGDETTDASKLETAQMLGVDDMVKITYERNRSKKNPVNENTGNLYIQPEQIEPVSYAPKDTTHTTNVGNTGYTDGRGRRH